MANPTTNYGFVLPTSSDLVADLPADFDVALQGVDTRLKALQPGTTQGDLAYSSATANTNTRLGIGSTGQVLTVAGGVPTWAAPAGGGKVLQVVTAVYGTSTTITSQSFTDTGLSATITPTSATNKILVLISQPASVNRNAVRAYAGWQYLRGATVLNTGSNPIGVYTDGAESVINSILSASYLDSPATTSATTYKTQGQTYDATGNVIFQAELDSTITLMEIEA